MRTLLGWSITPPEDEGQRRAAVLYLLGDDSLRPHVEEAFTKVFNPVKYSLSAGPNLGDGRVSGVAQWSLFPRELAVALGEPSSSPWVRMILERLQQQARDERNPGDFLERFNGTRS